MTSNPSTSPRPSGSVGPIDESAEHPQQRTQVQSLVRGLAVIRTFNAEQPRQTLSHVSEATGLARATARRFLHTLVDLGYAATDGSEFWLTPQILELGYSYLSSLSLPALAQPRLEELSRTIGESSSLSVRDGKDVVYVSRVPVRRIMTVAITIGTRFPAWATSMGRVLLADLSADELDDYLASTTLERLTARTITEEDTLREEIAAVREQGWSIVDQELEPGLRSLAAPVIDPSGHAVAAINVSTQTASYDLERLTGTILPEVLNTAALISADLAAQRK